MPVTRERQTHNEFRFCALFFFVHDVEHKQHHGEVGQYRSRRSASSFCADDDSAPLRNRTQRANRRNKSLCSSLIRFRHETRCCCSVAAYSRLVVRCARTFGVIRSFKRRAAVRFRITKYFHNFQHQQIDLSRTQPTFHNGRTSRCDASRRARRSSCWRSIWSSSGCRWHATSAASSTSSHRATATLRAA
jgi:hypothetical protein